MDPATATFFTTLALVLERTVSGIVSRVTSDKAKAKRLAAAAKKEAIKQANLHLARQIENKAKEMEAQLKADIEKLRRSRLGELERMRDEAAKPPPPEK